MQPRNVVTIHQPQYLPYIGMLAKIDAADSYIFFDTADYQIRYFDNRNRIMTKDGPKWLTVPVHASQKMSIRDVPIAGKTWVRKHLEMLRHAYGRAPFFDEYFSALAGLLEGHCRLADLCLQTFRWLLQSFGIQTRIFHASELLLGADAGLKAPIRLCVLSQAVGGTAYLAGPSWRDYMTDEDIAAFSKRRLSFLQAEIVQRPYPAHHGYVPYLSAIDLLFSMGQEGISIIRDSITVSEVRV